MARSNGVEIGDDIQFHIVDDLLEQEKAFASYGPQFLGTDTVSWNDFLNIRKNVLVKIDRSILFSDEGIVSVLAHEMHEINYLRKALSNGQTMSSKSFSSLIFPNYYNPVTKEWGSSIHRQAWEISDSMILRMRSK